MKTLLVLLLASPLYADSIELSVMGGMGESMAYMDGYNKQQLGKPGPAIGGRFLYIPTDSIFGYGASIITIGKKTRTTAQLYPGVNADHSVSVFSPMLDLVIKRPSGTVRPYLGAGFGYAMYKINRHYSLLDTWVWNDTLTNEDRSFTTQSAGVAYAGFGGIDIHDDNFFAGIEARILHVQGMERNYSRGNAFISYCAKVGVKFELE